MKKVLGFILFITVGLSGCTQRPMLNWVPASTTIMPAAVNNQTPMQITLTPPSGGTANNVRVAVYFTGGGTNATQTITVNIPNAQPILFTSDLSHYNQWETGSIPGTNSKQQATVVAAVQGGEYAVTAFPVSAGQPAGATGIELSTYTSANGSALVLVADTAATRP